MHKMLNFSNLVLISLIMFFLIACNGETVKQNDDGSNFETVKIGNQIWTKKNLDIDHYRNGDSIPEIRDSLVWRTLTTGAWCYNNYDSDNGEKYGKIYNGYAIIDPRGFAPEGWHIPTIEEWGTLSELFGGDSLSGGALKDTIGWTPQDVGATNASGFTALPAGYCSVKGFCIGLKYGAYFWTSTYDTVSSGWINARFILFNSPELKDLSTEKKSGFSVRLIKN